jgi:hypothetical protein
MDDITSRLRSGLHRPEAIILAGVSHDQRCLEAADEIERLRAELADIKAKYYFQPIPQMGSGQWPIKSKETSGDEENT